MKKKIVLIVASIFVVVATIAGVTYAFYSANVNRINESQTVVKTNKLTLTYTGGQEINVTGIVPGDSFTKTFTVENTSNIAVDYNIYMENITNEFNEDLVYELADETGNVIEETVLPVTNAKKKYLKANISIDAGVTKSYTLKITFKHSDNNQNNLQGKTFTATLGVDTEKVADYSISGYLTNENGEVIPNANLAVYSEEKHLTTTDSTGYFYVDGLEVGEHEIFYVENTQLEELKNYTKEEIQEKSSMQTTTNTKSGVLENNGNYEVKDSLVYPTTKTKKITLYTDNEKYIRLTKDNTAEIEISDSFGTKYLTSDSNIETSVDNKKITINNITKDTKLAYLNQTTWDYNYSGNEQSFTSIADGTYKIEAWGAQGGGSNSSTQYSGLGAYVSGEINLEYKKQLFVYVGGMGVTDGGVTYSGNIKGGYNNGGSTATNSVTSDGSGGGATDIRLTNGTTIDFESLKSRIMVAAGGGGSCFWSNNNFRGGAGGGLNGYEGIQINYNAGAVVGNATGGTQTAGGKDNKKIVRGKFGIGGNSANFGGAGGSGYYGGGGAYDQSSSTSGGAGGSSFISGHNGCNAISNDSTESNIIHTNQSNHYSGYVFTNTKMIDGTGYNWTTSKQSYLGMPSHNGSTTIKGNTGNGFAKITLVSLN